MKATFLGTGTSVGVPRIACGCPVCTSADPRNQRLRCSLLVEHQGRHLLIDATPDLRTQALRIRLASLDAVLITHAHADHLHGLDDVRCLRSGTGGSLPCHAAADTIERIRTVFDYAFRQDNPSSVPQLALQTVSGPFKAAGLAVTPVPLWHGHTPILGFRIGPLAYLTDCNGIPAAAYPLLADLEVLVLDALRDRPHPTHFSLDEAVAVARRLAPARALFTHMTHDLDHRSTNARLPAGMALAYDGLTIDLD